ncbi:polyprenyl synthetase family protein [Alkalicaulis satelles]|uniref:Polyprenyl synthetase family protein n=1 Tax=Alkalicaulis satelles TaxID=2609175 RepID=A0A5M6ZHB9_9PROT|nr:polyprenyl synthetase family protein [Alkalicaulis satelles]
MEADARIEAELRAALGRAAGTGCPPRFAAALEHAVFPGGARVRPKLCLAVAGACGDPDPALSGAVAAALELLHCASLVHDDLPAFDNADERRGHPSVHAAYGEPLAILAGDALIVLAFETVARAGAAAPERLPGLLSLIARAVGAPVGIAAGQAWESEPEVDVATYHRAKTGALFVGAVMAGAVSAGADPAPWRLMGEKIGEAYQVADDLLDAMGCADAGKPIGQDAALNRPSCARALGLDGAVARLRTLVAEAATAVPDCAGAPMLRELVTAQAKRLVPKNLAAAAA